MPERAIRVSRRSRVGLVLRGLGLAAERRIRPLLREFVIIEGLLIF